MSRGSKRRTRRRGFSVIGLEAFQRDPGGSNTRSGRSSAHSFRRGMNSGSSVARKKHGQDYAVGLGLQLCGTERLWMSLYQS